MTELNQLIEQQIDQYESRLKYIDGLLERAGKGVSAKNVHPDIHAQIGGLKNERDKLATLVDAVKQKSTNNLPENMFEQYGPMAIWDMFAQKLEKLVERIER
jgi:hypothetical protein